MRAVFVDTGGWMACADRTDPAHESCSAARDAALKAGKSLITSDLVIDETLTLIRFRLGLGAAIAWWYQIEGSGRVRCERIERDRFERARRFFFRYTPKRVSFTDCTTLVVMRELKLTTLITTDGHFRELGFRVTPSTRSGTARSRRARHK